MEKDIEVTAQNLLDADRRLRCCMTCSCIMGETGEINVRYGLRFKRNRKIIKDLPDISGNALEVRELMMRINRNRVSILHIDDIIDDFMASYSA